MGKYEISIKWKYSTETMTFDFDALPPEGTEIGTTEVWDEDPEVPLDYIVVVQGAERKGAVCTLTLAYEESRNEKIAQRNATWGTSILTVDLSAGTPTATAQWKSKPKDVTMDGTVRKITFRSVSSDDVLEDLLAIGGDVPTEKAVMVAARIGQGRFRSEVIAAWKRGERCALTGIAIPEMLVASHIKPWRDCNDRERLDPANGLLLATHVDKLFDRFLLSFKPASEDTYVVQLHPRVRKVARDLKIDEDCILDVSRLGHRAPAFRRFMEEHHRHFLSRVAEEGKPA